VAAFDDADVLEMLDSMVFNIYTNHIARTDLDFPAAMKRAV
jgi:hypothetical protein